MASLADLEIKSRGNHGAGAALAAPRAPKNQATAPSGETAPKSDGAKAQRRINGELLVVVAATIGLGAMAFGYQGLWSAVESLRRTPGGTQSIAAAPGTSGDSASDPAFGRSSLVGPTDGADLAAGRGEAAVPRRAHSGTLLTTPNLPTVASPADSADDLYSLALDLAMADRETSAIAFARAAAREHARAAYYIAQLYETGDGVPLNLGLARAWYIASGMPESDARLVPLDASAGAGNTAAPRLLSAARTSDGYLELVWTSATGGPGIDFLVEIYEDLARAPVVAESLDRSALRLEAPAGELFWRVIARGEIASASDLQRIPPTEKTSLEAQTR
jgi:hypothetical protein